MAGIHYLFVGNPGTGKSTILNALMKELRFKAGFCPGRGLTFKLQVEAQDGDTFMDTPGLADVQLRRQAAEAISQALRRGGRYRLFFVLTLEAGRVKPADVATMQLVLGAAPEIGSNYGVIINKVPKATVRRITEQQEVRDEILGSMFSGEAKPTIYVSYNPKVDDLDDADNVLAELRPELEGLIRSMPPVEVSPDRVTDVKGDEFEALEAKFETILRELREDNGKLREVLAQQQAQMERQAEEFARAREEQRAALQERQKEFQQLQEEARRKEEQYQQALKEQREASAAQQAEAAEQHKQLLARMEADREDARRREDEMREKMNQAQRSQGGLLGDILGSIPVAGPLLRSILS